MTKRQRLLHLAIACVHEQLIDDVCNADVVTLARWLSVEQVMEIAQRAEHERGMAEC